MKVIVWFSPVVAGFIVILILFFGPYLLGTSKGNRPLYMEITGDRVVVRDSLDHVEDGWLKGDFDLTGFGFPSDGIIFLKSNSERNVYSYVVISNNVITFFEKEGKYRVHRGKVLTNTVSDRKAFIDEVREVILNLESPASSAEYTSLEQMMKAFSG